MSNPLIAYYIENMASKEFIETLFNKYGIKYRKSYKYEKHKEVYINSGINIPEKDFVELCRKDWQSAPILYHKNNLSSGILTGHSWHKAMPSNLHYSLQEKVRECIKMQGEIKDLLEIAKDIMKHEYFMTATHDICESSIIEQFTNSLPPSRNKSISDFTFNGIPYDLKVSTYPEGWNNIPCKSQDEQIGLIKSFVGGADSLRVRNEAIGAYNGWGDNRFYIVVADQNRWINNTDALLSEIMNKISSLKKPLVIDIDNETIWAQIVEV